MSERNDKNDLQNDCNVENNEFEHILSEFGGSYGKFQLFNMVLYTISFVFAGIVALNYVFTSLNLDYR